jgi:hypothetical protein
MGFRHKGNAAAIEGSHSAIVARLEDYDGFHDVRMAIQSREKSI